MAIYIHGTNNNFSLITNMAASVKMSEMIFTNTFSSKHIFILVHSVMKFGHMYPVDNRFH